MNGALNVTRDTNHNEALNQAGDFTVKANVQLLSPNSKNSLTSGNLKLDIDFICH